MVTFGMRNMMAVTTMGATTAVQIRLEAHRSVQAKCIKKYIKKHKLSDQKIRNMARFFPDVPEGFPLIGGLATEQLGAYPDVFGTDYVTLHLEGERKRFFYKSRSGGRWRATLGHYWGSQFVWKGDRHYVSENLAHPLLAHKFDQILEEVQGFQNQAEQEKVTRFALRCRLPVVEELEAHQGISKEGFGADKWKELECDKDPDTTKTVWVTSKIDVLLGQKVVKALEGGKELGKVWRDAIVEIPAGDWAVAGHGYKKRKMKDADYGKTARSFVRNMNGKLTTDFLSDRKNWKLLASSEESSQAEVEERGLTDSESEIVKNFGLTKLPTKHGFLGNIENYVYYIGPDSATAGFEEMKKSIWILSYSGKYDIGWVADVFPADQASGLPSSFGTKEQFFSGEGLEFLQKKPLDYVSNYSPKSKFSGLDDKHSLKIFHRDTRELVDHATYVKNQKKNPEEPYYFLLERHWSSISVIKWLRRERAHSVAAAWFSEKEGDETSSSAQHV